MIINERIESFAILGQWLRKGLKEVMNGKGNELSIAIKKAEIENPWFTEDSVVNSLQSIAGWLDPKVLDNWAGHYHLSEPVKAKKIAVIMAGNIPLVNFHDFLSVLITGHHFIGKLSSQDKVLLPFLVSKLVELNSHWKESISFTEERLDTFEAVIATGSNNTSRYFQYYFSRYPHIIRNNRNSVAVLTGTESIEDLHCLYSDIFEYYGMGCRNVSILLVPTGYNFPQLFDIWEALPNPTDHYKYKNNYDYYRSIYLINSQKHFDTGYVSVLKADSVASPLSVLHYKEYKDSGEVNHFLKLNLSGIQCIVSKVPIQGFSTIQPGKAQQPEIMDYPDGVDIIQFLLAL